MMKKHSAVLSLRVMALIFLAMFGVSACAPYMDMEPAKSSSKKARSKKVARGAYFSCNQSGTGTTCFAVSPTPVKPKKGKLLVAGSGLKPGQVLYIHTTMDNIWSDITYLVAGKGKMLVANKYGAFASWWKLKPRYFKKLLIPGKVYTLSLVDESGQELGSAPLVIAKAKSKKKKK